MGKIRDYIEDSTNELVNKVSWPTWSELQGSAVVVMIASLIIAIIVFFMDFGFSKLMKLCYQILS